MSKETWQRIYRKINFRNNQEKILRLLRLKRTRSLFSVVLLIMLMILVYKIFETSTDILKTELVEEVHEKNKNIIEQPNTEKRILPKARKQKKLGPSIKDSEIFWERRKRLIEACEDYPEIRKSIDGIPARDLTHIFINREHKFLYCGLPKTGLLNWRKVLAAWAGRSSDTDINGLTGTVISNSSNFLFLGLLTEKEKEDVLDGYTKFLIIRHPFERILSIFSSKFKSTKYNKFNREVLDRAVIKYIRKKVPEEQLGKLHDVTFEEFLRFCLLVSKNPPVQDLKVFQYHDFWKTMNDLCYPCAIKYTQIGNFDTIVRDSHHVLKLIGSKVDFPIDMLPRETNENVKNTYSKLPKDLIKDIRKYYEYDMKIFGYSQAIIH